MTGSVVSAGDVASAVVAHNENSMTRANRIDSVFFIIVPPSSFWGKKRDGLHPIVVTLYNEAKADNIEKTDMNLTFSVY